MIGSGYTFGRYTTSDDVALSRALYLEARRMYFPVTDDVVFDHLVNEGGLLSHFSIDSFYFSLCN